MPVVFDSSGPVREMFESFAPQVIRSNDVFSIELDKWCNFHSCHQNNAIPVSTALYIQRTNYKPLTRLL